MTQQEVQEQLLVPILRQKQLLFERYREMGPYIVVLGKLWHRMMSRDYNCGTAECPAVATVKDRVLAITGVLNVAINPVREDLSVEVVIEAYY